MSKSQIQQQQAIYYALMDLKQDIQKLKHTNKTYDEQIKKCYNFSQKTYIEMNDKFNEVVKLMTQSHTQIIKQNGLIVQQNQVHCNLTKSNELLVDKIKVQNTKLNQIFNQQKVCMDRVLKANQVIVNQQLTAICKDQQNKIKEQIQEFDKQNKFIEQQKLKIQLAFQAVANFEARNKQLQEKLLKQKQQIDKFIQQTIKTNQQLVISQIYSRAAEAQRNYQYKLDVIQNIRNLFEQSKNQGLNIFHELIRKQQYAFSTQINNMERIKNQTASIRNESQRYCNQQKVMLKQSKQQLQNIKDIKNGIDRKQNQMESQMNKTKNQVREQERKTFEKVRTVESKLSDLQNKLKNVSNNQSNYQNKIKDVQRVANQAKNGSAKIQQIKKDINLIESKIQQLEKQIKQRHHHHSHSHGKH